MGRRTGVVRGRTLSKFIKAIFYLQACAHPRPKAAESLRTAG